VSGSRTSEEVPVRAYRCGTPSGEAVRERPSREPSLRSVMESKTLPVRYERFDGAAVVVYKVRPSAPAGFPQPEPPDVPQPEPPVNLPRQE
jgi:hypothetical protein